MHHPLEDVQDFSDSCIRCGLCAQTDCGNFSNGEPNLGELCESILNGEETKVKLDTNSNTLGGYLYTEIEYDEHGYITSWEKVDRRSPS